MNQTRRDLLRWSAVGVSGVFAFRGYHPVVAQSTPSASPEMSEGEVLLMAPEATSLDPPPQWIAVMDAEAYARAHIEGDVRIGVDELVPGDTTPEGLAGWNEEMRDLFGVRRVRADRPVVAYDDGSLFAARVWWQLAYMGFTMPQVMDGGIDAWRGAGGDVVMESPGIDPLEVPLVDEDEIRPEMLATRDEIVSSLDMADVFILDARSPDEYRAGHIPGAASMPYMENAMATEAIVYLAPAQLRERYERLGMTDDKRAITYCSTGARGAVSAFAMRLAGFTDVALYIGSWNEWSADPDAPVEEGSA